MIDITDINEDIEIFDTQVKRAENIVATQLGKLTYEPDFGVDLEYFLSPDYEFQNSAFTAYILQRLAEQSVNVATVTTIINKLFSKNTFEISAIEQGQGLVK